MLLLTPTIDLFSRAGMRMCWGSYEHCPTSKVSSFHLKTTIWSTTFGVENIKQNSKMVTLEAYGATFFSFCSPHEQSVPI